MSYVQCLQIDKRQTKVFKVNNVKPEIRKAHPILDYRIKKFARGRGVRGIKPTDAIKCAIVLDDSVIAGDYHFPCVIYMRENGNPIGKVSENMRAERKKWFDKHNSANDTECLHPEKIL